MKQNTVALTISSSGAMASTNTITSQPIPIDQIFGYAIQAVWTGTPNGTIKLQASCDPVSRNTQVSSGGPDGITNWDDIASSSQSIAGTAGSFTWNVNGAFYSHVRLVYTNTSSTGTLSANASLKG